MGFISNPSEEDFLNSEIGQSYMASAIFRAIKDYKNELELSSSNLAAIPFLNEIKVDSTKLLPKNETTQKGVIFKVQIKTSLEEKEIASIMEFKVDVFKEKNMFKYTIGNEEQLEKAKEIQKIAVEKGYKDAFIIAFLNNKKIGISDAINFQKTTIMKAELKIGIIGIFSILLLIWGISFLKGNNIFGNSNVYYSTYKNIDGLESSAPVRINGLTVGNVTEIYFHPNNSGDIIVQFTINDDIRFPRNSIAKIYNSDIMGTKAVQLIYGNSNLFASPGDTLFADIENGLKDEVNKQVFL